MRPLGGLLFGHLGDRVGRAAALKLSIALMAVASVLVGLLPGYAQIDLAAPVLLVLIRLVQGVAVGGELVGSVTYLVEAAPRDRRGLVGSWSLVGAVSGILLGSLVATVLQLTLPETALQDWGWRVPFLLGVVLFFVGGWLRRDIREPAPDETPDVSAAPGTPPILEVLRGELPMVSRISAIMLAYAANFYLLFVWMPTYLTHIVSPPVDHALLANSIGMIVLLAAMPFAGHLSDRFGRGPVIGAGLLVIALSAWPLFLVLDTHGLVAAVLVQGAVAVGAVQGPMPAFLVEAFARHTRFTAIGMSYNLSLALFGGTAPLVATWLIDATGNLAAPAFYVAALCAASLIPWRFTGGSRLLEVSRGKLCHRIGEAHLAFCRSRRQCFRVWV